MTYRKKLIEVAMPLKAINEGSKPETENPFLKRHPRAVHNWWARTPLSVCRAILFAQLVDDPSNDLPPERALEERKRLFDIVSRLATWEAIADENLLSEAKAIIRKSCGGEMPQFWDLFSGRASIPLEAQRLGLQVTDSDLNPVSVLIGKVLLDFPQRFNGQAAVNSDIQEELLQRKTWKGTAGLIEDVHYYGKWLRDEAEKRVGHLYPKVKLSEEHGGGEATVIAWLWARSVKCPNPACGAKIPLVQSFWLSKKQGKKAWIEPIINKTNKTVAFEIKTGNGVPPKPTKVGRGARFRCLVCCEDCSEQHIKDESMARRLGSQLMAIAAEGKRERIYLSPSEEHLKIAESAEPSWGPDAEMNRDTTNLVSGRGYGFFTWADLFTQRQLSALATFSDLVSEAREQIQMDAIKAGCEDSEAYADAIVTYLACGISRLSDYCNSFCTWNPTNENVRNLFQRQAIPMVWDFAEANPLYGKLSIESTVNWVAEALTNLPIAEVPARVLQLDARNANVEFVTPPIISTDPPYYDNIGYADLSDFFYIWLRRTLREVHSTVFATLLTPKESELIAAPYRHSNSTDLAREHFRDGFNLTFKHLKSVANPNFPMTVYYAFKQEESDNEAGDQRASTGWETMLEGLIAAEFQVTGTLPVRTTKKARSIAQGTNALASAIVLVCRSLPGDAPIVTRRELIAILRRELPSALRNLQESHIAPVDLAQAAIGPGMAIFSRYSKVFEADGTPMRVRTALEIINNELDAYFAEQESNFDTDTRFCIEWFELYGMREGPFDEAQVLARAKNIGVRGIEESGVLQASGGKVRLLSREEYPDEWDPTSDRRVNIWECAQYLIRALHQGGETEAARLANQLNSDQVENARALAYRLFAICERIGWAQEAIAYNTLITSWTHIQETRTSSELRETQQEFDIGES